MVGELAGGIPLDALEIDQFRSVVGEGPAAGGGAVGNVADGNGGQRRGYRGLRGCGRRIVILMTGKDHGGHRRQKNKVFLSHLIELVSFKDTSDKAKTLGPGQSGEIFRILLL